jgi:hypothetical protein
MKTSAPLERPLHQFLNLLLTKLRQIGADGSRSKLARMKKQTIALNEGSCVVWLWGDCRGSGRQGPRQDARSGFGDRDPELVGVAVEAIKKVTWEAVENELRHNLYSNWIGSGMLLLRR